MRSLWIWKAWSWFATERILAGILPFISISNRMVSLVWVSLNGVNIHPPMYPAPLVTFFGTGFKSWMESYE